VETVGRSSPDRAVTPVNQILTPAGRQLDLPGMRPQALALSPDGKLLVVSGKTSELVVVDRSAPRFGNAWSCPASSSGQRLPTRQVRPRPIAKGRSALQAWFSRRMDPGSS
jgi:hypothetical protein